MATTTDDEDLELRHYVDVLRRRKLSVILAVAVALAAGVAFTLLRPRAYSATAEVLVQPPLSERIFTPTADRTDAAAGSDVATQVAVLQSTSIRDAAEKALGGRTVDVTVKRNGDTDVIQVTATAGSRAQAIRDAQVYTDTYLGARKEQSTAELNATIDAVKAEIGAIDGLVADLDRRIQDLNTQIQATFLREVRAPLEAQRDQLTQQRQGPDARRSDLQQRLDRLQLAASVTKTGGVELLSPATAPAQSSRSLLFRNLAVALALGLIAGVIIAFLRDHFDDRVRSETDLERTTGDVPVLGLIPAVPDWRERDSTELVMLSAPESPAAEAYARLRTALEAGRITAPGRTLQVTSAGPGDGKTTTLANLGVSFAKAGRRVLLVDGNLRRPRLHRFFDLDNQVGLSSVLLGTAPVSSTVQVVPGLERLRILPSGPRPWPSSPSELLAGERVGEVISSLTAQYDLVLIDSPPLPVSDAVAWNGRVGAVILVVCAGRTRRRHVEEALQALHQAQAPLAGTILNCAPGKVGHGLTYGRERAGHRTQAPPSAPEARPERAGKATAATKKPPVSVEEPKPVEPVDR